MPIKDNGTIRMLSEGEIHIDHAVYSTVEATNVTMKITSGAIIHRMPDFNETTIDATKLIHPIDGKEHYEHNKMLLENGQDFERWEAHLTELAQRKHDIKNAYKLTYGLSRTTVAVLITAGLLIYVRKRWSKQPQTNGKQRTPDIEDDPNAIEMREMATKPRVGHFKRSHTLGRGVKL